MNLKELKAYFEKNNVPDEYYVIEGLGAGEVDGIGKIDNCWATYYSERGSKKDIKYYDTEDEACRALIQEISSIMEQEEGISLLPIEENN